HVTGVQTCALPISNPDPGDAAVPYARKRHFGHLRRDRPGALGAPSGQDPTPELGHRPHSPGPRRARIISTRLTRDVREGGRMISIVLADDHKVVREGLRLLLEGNPDFSVVGEESDGLRVVDLVDRLRPDVLVVDLMMPGLGGLEVTRRVTKWTPGTRVVILSMHDESAYVWEGLNNGASAYVLKDAGADCLAQAVREAAAG